MKGFYIEISNELLDPKHCQSMGEAIWLFMWLLDKMTIIDSEIGEGKVLGGKPIKYGEVKHDLGVSRSTYMRWIDVLRAGDYIQTTRTPYGQSITVMKAKKRFGRSVKNDTSRSAENDTSDVAETKHLSPENGTSNKTVAVDSTVRQNNKSSRADGAEEKTPVDEHSSVEAQIGEVIFRFKEVNPSYKVLFNRKPQREAARGLLDQFGFQKVVAMVSYLEHSNGIKYAPTITTPAQLVEKMGELKAWADKQRNGSKGKGIISAVPTP